MRRRGFTLIEMLFTCILTVLTFTLGYQILIPAFRIWAINQAQANIEETGLVVETRIMREIERSTRQSLTVTMGTLVANPPNGVLQATSFASTGQQDGADSYDTTSGQAVWQYFIIYYVPQGSTTLYRKIWPVPGLPYASQVPAECDPFHPVQGTLPYAFPNSRPVPLTIDNLIAICDSTNGTEAAVGSSISRFTVAAVGASNARVTVDLSGTSVAGPITSQRNQQFQFRM